MTPPRRRRRKPVGWILGVPTALCAAAFTAVADNMLGAAMMGALVGFTIGIGLLAFPNLDRGGPADNEDFLH
jgi:hypothetical protein